ncbi:conserved hypothetical protein [Paecilomyces variotii No. 5]|uniref:Uncharacterized protein n=1 Tax=Byssochlamys spectabilis (strain No. 5 / NBRC 109023) TaxID=1356009 RepID=V5FRA6_BYSSN|nr:conserved hypothetical protein [Paecilomyces variotii No. 5]
MSRSTALHPRDYRRPGQEEEDAIIIDDDNDDLMQIDAPETTPPAGQFHFHHQQQRQHQHQRMGYGHNPHDPSSITSDRARDTGRGYLTASAYEKKARSIHREGRHSALCVLSDRELLMIQALAAHETIPQTRRRFLAQLMAPDDPRAATAIRMDRFTAAGSSHPVPGTVIDVYEDDDAGWRRPDAGTPSKSKGKTPERDRDRERDRARRSLGRQHRERERERRRRWSGSEREFESQAI